MTIESFVLQEIESRIKVFLDNGGESLARAMATRALDPGDQIDGQLATLSQRVEKIQSDIDRLVDCITPDTKEEIGKRIRRHSTDRTQTTVWQIGREGNYEHPTQKPVALVSKALRNSTVRGERVLDPFLGSGTTLIAAEQLGRTCLALELDGRYCDVAVKRWEAYAGKVAEHVQTHLPGEAEVPK